MSEITKTQTRTIFDRSKIGVGDVVEFYEYEIRMFTKENKYRIAGIVRKVEDTTLLVDVRRAVFDDGSIETYGLPVEMAHEIKVLFKYEGKQRR